MARIQENENISVTPATVSGAHWLQAASVLDSADSERLLVAESSTAALSGDVGDPWGGHPQAAAGQRAEAATPAPLQKSSSVLILWAL